MPNAHGQVTMRTAVATETARETSCVAVHHATKPPAATSRTDAMYTRARRCHHEVARARSFAFSIGARSSSRSDDASKSVFASSRTASAPTEKAPAGTTSPAPYERGRLSPLIQSSEKTAGARRDRDQTPGRDEERAALAQLLAGHELDEVAAQAAREEPFGPVAGEEPRAVALDDALLEPAPEQHESDEHVERVEVRGLRAMRDVRLHGPREGERDPERDRQVEMEDSGRSRPPRRTKEARASDEHGHSAEPQVEGGEQGEERPAIEPGVHRDREDHRVHRDGDAHTHAPE